VGAVHEVTAIAPCGTSPLADATGQDGVDESTPAADPEQPGRWCVHDRNSEKKTASPSDAFGRAGHQAFPREILDRAARGSGRGRGMARPQNRNSKRAPQPRLGRDRQGHSVVCGPGRRLGS